MHRPVESIFVAISRSLILPVLALTVLPLFFGDFGVYAAIPVAEILTCLFVIYLFFKNRPFALVNVNEIAFSKSK